MQEVKNDFRTHIPKEWIQRLGGVVTSLTWVNHSWGGGGSKCDMSEPQERVLILDGVEVLWEKESFQFGFKRWWDWPVPTVLWEQIPNAGSKVRESAKDMHVCKPWNALLPWSFAWANRNRLPVCRWCYWPAHMRGPCPKGSTMKGWGFWPSQSRNHLSGM